MKVLTYIRMCVSVCAPTHVCLFIPVSYVCDVCKSEVCKPYTSSSSAFHPCSAPWCSDRPVLCAVLTSQNPPLLILHNTLHLPITPHVPVKSDVHVKPHVPAPSTCLPINKHQSVKPYILVNTRLSVNPSLPINPRLPVMPHLPVEPYLPVKMPHLHVPVKPYLPIKSQLPVHEHIYPSSQAYPSTLAYRKATPTHRATPTRQATATCQPTSTRQAYIPVNLPTCKQTPTRQPTLPVNLPTCNRTPYRRHMQLQHLVPPAHTHILIPSPQPTISIHPSPQTSGKTQINHLQ